MKTLDATKRDKDASFRQGVRGHLIGGSIDFLGLELH